MQYELDVCGRRRSPSKPCRASGAAELDRHKSGLGAFEASEFAWEQETGRNSSVYMHAG